MSFQFDRNANAYSQSGSTRGPGSMRDYAGMRSMRMEMQRHGDRRRNYQDQVLHSRQAPSRAMQKYCEAYYSPDEDAAPQNSRYRAASSSEDEGTFYHQRRSNHESHRPARSQPRHRESQCCSKASQLMFTFILATFDFMFKIIQCLLNLTLIIYQVISDCFNKKTIQTHDQEPQSNVDQQQQYSKIQENRQRVLNEINKGSTYQNNQLFSENSTARSGLVDMLSAKAQQKLDEQADISCMDERTREQSQIIENTGGNNENDESMISDRGAPNSPKGYRGAKYAEMNIFDTSMNENEFANQGVFSNDLAGMRFQDTPRMSSQDVNRLTDMRMTSQEREEQIPDNKFDQANSMLWTPSGAQAKPWSGRGDGLRQENTRMDPDSNIDSLRKSATRRSLLTRGGGNCRGESHHYLPALVHDLMGCTVYSIQQIGGLAIVALVCVGLLSDLASKHGTELQLQGLKIAECRRHFRENRCDEPVPVSRDFCNEQERCLLQEANAVVKHVNVFFKLLAEIMNDFAQVLSNRTLIVLCVLFLVLLAAYKLYNNVLLDRPHAPNQPQNITLTFQPPSIQNNTQQDEYDTIRDQLKRPITFTPSQNEKNELSMYRDHRQSLTQSSLRNRRSITHRYPSSNALDE